MSFKVIDFGHARLIGDKPGAKLPGSPAMEKWYRRCSRPRFLSYGCCSGPRPKVGRPLASPNTAGLTMTRHRDIEHEPRPGVCLGPRVEPASCSVLSAQL